MTPNAGNKINGSNAATGFGTASVIHHAIIHNPTARTREAPGAISSGSTNKKMIRKIAGPRKNPILRVAPLTLGSVRTLDFRTQSFR
jgi:hypothetical protein